MITEYQTIKEAGYTYIKYLGYKQHILKSDSNIFELWISNKYHPNWGLIYKNTHLEFCLTLQELTIKFINK